MPCQQNINLLEEVKGKKNKSKSVIFIHYRGLGSNDLNNLRSKVKAAGGEVSIYKNTLLKIAFAKEELNSSLIGPTAAVFAYEDEIAPLKILADFNKNKELPTFTAGFLDDRVLSADDLIKLSKLPGKLELQAKVVGSLAAPLSGIVNVLQGNIRKFVYVLEAIKNQKN